MSGGSFFLGGNSDTRRCFRLCLKEFWNQDFLPLLRDNEPFNGGYGFLLPRDQIKASGEELWPAQKVIFQKMVHLSNDGSTPHLS